MGKDWSDKAFSWLGSAFLFVSGVAIGKGSGADEGMKGAD